MTIVINPTYSRLRSFVENIPAKFNNEGEMVYEARNQLKKFTVEGYEVIVKRYKIPFYINRIAYTFVRPSKAKRAYEYALKLLDLGLNSPAPIAYIEQFKGGLLTHGYFISIFEKDYSDIRDLMDGIQQDADLLQQLSVYIADIHSKGVLHLDMSPGNILYKKVGDNYNFTLIDINRMQFLPSVSAEKRFSSFKRLSSNEEVLTSIAKVYATASKLNESKSIKEINKASFEFFNSRKVRNRE
jgi:serine/threonine protein kinase